METRPHAERFLSAPRRTFFRLWLPVLFSLVAEPLTGMVDTAFVSRLGAQALAALGVGTMVLSSVFWIFNFLAIGSQTEVSQSRGRGDEARAARVASLALTVAAAAGLVLAGLAFLFSGPVAALMGADGAVHAQAVTYIRLRALGAPAVLVAVTCFGVLYGLQDMRTPLWIAAGINGVNVVLDALLIFGAGPIPPMGIAGAALASAAGQWIGALWGAAALRRRLGLSRGIRLGDLAALLRVGFDLFVRTGLLTGFLLLATRAATRMGPEAGAAHQAIRQVWIFTALFLDASAITAQSLVGFFVGSGRMEEARRVAGFVCRWTALIGGAIAAGMLAGRHLAAAALVPPSARELFFPAWAAAALFQPVSALAFVTDGIHWGTGDYRFLRNVVVLATLFGLAGIWQVEEGAPGALTRLWWITGGWVAVRAVFGVARIWPGIGKGPFGPKRAKAARGP